MSGSPEFLQKENKEKIQERGRKLLKVERILFIFMIIVAVIVILLVLQSRAGL